MNNANNNTEIKHAPGQSQKCCDKDSPGIYEKGKEHWCTYNDKCKKQIYTCFQQQPLGTVISIFSVGLLIGILFSRK